jgi:hypothetical protein
MEPSRVVLHSQTMDLSCSALTDETGRERAHLYYIPKRGSGVYLQGESSKETATLLLPAGGQNPKLDMTDQAGKSVATMPPQPLR